MQNKKTLELYFHIPFCVKKCLYCDFLSAPADEHIRLKYMEALLTETVGSAAQYQDYIVDSIFIGGGTPSVVDAGEMVRLMAAVKKYYRLAENAEVTIEVNPGTVDLEKLQIYRKAGMNRLSIGMQSAHNEELLAIGRIHTWEQFESAFTEARKAGFDNINVDIMSALPGQTCDSYEKTLKKVLGLKNPPEHISAYSLIVEEGTPFFEMYEDGRLQIPDEDADRLMYHRTKEVLADAGYRRYEISNYAKEGYACRHNVGYWTRKNYVGFGIGAASLVENVRFHNCSDIKAYIGNPLSCREEETVLSKQEQMEEMMFLGLRLVAGVDGEYFFWTFGKTLEEVYGEIIEKNIREGLLEWRMDDSVWGESNAEKRGGDEGLRKVRKYLKLTEQGLDLSNYVMAQFLF